GPDPCWAVGTRVLPPSPPLGRGTPEPSLTDPTVGRVFLRDSACPPAASGSVMEWSDDWRRGWAMLRGPGVLFASWVLHDIEEALAFPSTTEHLAVLTGIDVLRMNTKQSVAAIGLVGAVLARAGGRGPSTPGASPLSRYAVAGLEGHVFTHLMASGLLRRYTAGVITAVPVMWPGAAFARRELAAAGRPLDSAEWRRGGMVMAAVALSAHGAVRVDWSARIRSRRSNRTSRSRVRRSSAGGGAG